MNSTPEYHDDFDSDAVVFGKCFDSSWNGGSTAVQIYKSGVQTHQTHRFHYSAYLKHTEIKWCKYLDCRVLREQIRDDEVGFFSCCLLHVISDTSHLSERSQQTNNSSAGQWNPSASVTACRVAGEKVITGCETPGRFDVCGRGKIEGRMWSVISSTFQVVCLVEPSWSSSSYVNPVSYFCCWSWFYVSFLSRGPHPRRCPLRLPPLVIVVIN